MIPHVLFCWILAGIGALFASSEGDQAVSCTQPVGGAVKVPDRLKVVTYNVHHCWGGMDRIIKLLREQEADVVFLQEVDRGEAGVDDQAAQIAKALGGMHLVSAATLGVPARQHCDEAILSRFELCDGAAHCVNKGGWAYAVHARVKERRPKLHLLSVHTRATGHLKTKHVIESSKARLAQVLQLLEVVRKLEGDVIVAGDFNATPWMPEYHGITSLLTDFGAVSGESKLTFPSHRPTLRIDYVFGRGEFVAASFRVLEARWSDHRPVVAEIETSKRRSVETSERQEVETGCGAAKAKFQPRAAREFFWRQGCGPGALQRHGYSPRDRKKRAWSWASWVSWWNVVLDGSTWRPRPLRQSVPSSCRIVSKLRTASPFIVVRLTFF